jgi:hypothetical protein
MSSPSSTVMVIGFSQSTWKAGFQKGLGDLEMGGVRGGDGDQVDTVFARRSPSSISRQSP